MSNSTLDRPSHGHHKLAASIFVGSLIVGASLIMSGELTKPERYEYHPGNTPTSYVIYDRDTGRATVADYNSKTPMAALKD